MATIQGIQFENDANGNPQFIKIDLEKYGTQLRPFLKKVGVELEKDAFDLDLENAISSSKAREITKEKIKSWWKK
jgi:hypothetical protein